MSWRRILLLTAACLVFLLAATWVVLQESGATRAFVRSMLGRVLAADWALQDAVVDLGQGTLTITGLRIDDPQAQGHRLAQVDQLRLGIDTNPLGDLLAVHTVEIEGLDLRIDLRTGRVPALTDLLRAGDATAPKDRLPPILVRRSRVELQVAADAPPLVLADVNLDLLPERTTPSRAHLSGTAHSPELGLTFTLDGMADLARTEFQATARMPPLRVDDELLRRLRLYVPGLPSTGITGSLQQVVLWFEMRGAPADDGTVAGPAAGLVAEARNVTCRLPQIPYPITGASGEFAASTLEGGSLRVAFRQSSEQGDLDVRTEMVQLWSEPRFEIRAKGRSVRVDADSIGAMQSFASGRDIMAALQPTAGRIDLEMFLQRRHDGSEDLEVDVGVTGAEMTYRGFGNPPLGFPLPLTAVSGNVHVRDGVISIDNASGQVRPEAGGGTVRCNGTVAIDPQKPTRVAVDLDSPRLQFTAAVREALGTLLHDKGELYDEFRPTGAAAVAVRIRPTDEGGWQVRLSPDDASITWRGMPVPVEALSGLIQVHSSGVLFDVKCKRSSGSVQARGRMRFPATGDASGDTEIWVAARDLPLDASMRKGIAVLAPDVESIWAELQPEGRCSAEVTVWRAFPEAEFGYDGHLSFHDCRLAPVTLALPLEKVTGSLFLHGRGQEQRLDLDAIRAELRDLEGSGKAIVTAVGSMRRLQGSPAHGDLTAVVRDLRLDDRLANSLDRLGALSRRTWSVLRPSGIVDMVFHRQRSLAGAAVNQDLIVQLRGVGSDAEMLPQPAREVTGQLRITDGRVDFSDLRAKMSQAIVICDRGHVATSTEDPTRTEVVFDVNSDRFPVDDNLAKLFEGPMRKAILDRQLHGSARVSKLRLKFLVPPEDSGQPFETTVSGFFQPFDVSLVLGARVEGVHGLVQLFESRVDRTGGTLSGTLENGSFRVFGQPCEGLTGGFSADPDKIVFDPLSVRLHGGRIQGFEGGKALTYTLGSGGPGSLAANVEFDGINLNDMLEYGGMVMPPYSGTLRGQIRLDELRGADFVDMRGEGRVQLLDGNLGTVPVFTAIYAMVSESDRPRFESAAARFRVGERKIEFEDLTLTSPLFQVHGTGTLSMDGYVDIKMTLDTLFGGSADMLLLPPILEAITSRLVRFHLFGPMRDLHAEQRWITQRDPRRLGLVPVPPPLEKPKRPDY